MIQIQIEPEKLNLSFYMERKKNIFQFIIIMTIESANF